MRPRHAALAADAHAGLALMLDSIVNLSLLAGILRGFGLPAWIVFGRMLPGSALAALVGNVCYASLANRLRRRGGGPDVTAMPCGLDTPSTIGIALTVLGPAFVAQRGALVQGGMAPEAATDAAGLHAWQLGMAMMVLLAGVKLCGAGVGAMVQRHIPQAGLMGSLGGIGLMLLIFLPLIEIFRAPLVGMLAWGVIMVSLVGRRRLPHDLPGVGVAVLLGLGMHYLCGPWHLPGIGPFSWPSADLSPALPWPTLQFLWGMPAAIAALPLALPFALLTIVGGINTCASAQAAGDAYTPRSVLAIDALATFSAALCGGVVQSTPYIGHPAYKRMGARTHYVLIAGIGVAGGAALGAITLATHAVPLAAVMPILLFVGLEIGRQAIETTPARHLPAVLLALMPTLAHALLLRVEALMAHVRAGLEAPELHARVGAAMPQVLQLLEAGGDAVDLGILRMLGHGFILTAMLWGGWAAHLIDNRLPEAAALLLVCAALTAVGLIHAPSVSGALFWPWDMPAFEGVGLCIGYTATAGLLMGLHRVREAA